MVELSHTDYLRLALRLARRGHGATSPNPMVGAVLVKDGKIIGRGWHRRAGGPHAEIEALQDAQKRGNSPRGAALYATLEPCSTHGRTPPCTKAIIAAGITRLFAGATDPNPKHAGNGFEILRAAGVQVAAPGQDAASMRLANECALLNEPFNHWIVRRTPFVTVKSAMTLDGKIATASGQSKWITGEPARALGMNLRQDSDAILVGINTILADDPSLSVRKKMKDGSWKTIKPIRRIILDSHARTPLSAKVVRDNLAAFTTVVVGKRAPQKRVAALAKHVKVLIAPTRKALSSATSPRRGPRRPSSLDLRWLLKKLGGENVVSLLVEGGGEVNASFLMGGLAQRVVFFYAPKIMGGRGARKGVAGDGAAELRDVLQLDAVRWRKAGGDLMLTARVRGGATP